MKTLNERFKSILYLVSDIIEQDSEHNYKDRDVSLHKLHHEWNEFINDNSKSLDPYQLSIKNQIKLEIFDQNCITDKMNKHPWSYCSHYWKHHNVNVYYLHLNSIWYYYDIGLKKWIKSSFNYNYLCKKLTILDFSSGLIKLHIQKQRHENFCK